MMGFAHSPGIDVELTCSRRRTLPPRAPRTFRAIAA